MGGGQAVSRVVAGIGCRSGCAADEIVDLVRDACARAGRQATALSAPAFKQGESGLQEASRRLGLPLQWIDEPALRAAQERCITRSGLAERAVGVASVAEGSALASIGAGGRLLLARIASAGATCALAEEGGA
jgi:cobalt-precorrin 5A hydrolase